MTLLVKYGGNAMSDPATIDPVLVEIAELWEAGREVVLVHGGGPEIDAALDRRGISSERIAGNRVTSEDALEVTEAVLCGTVNKRIVRACAALGLPAVGISGEDGATLIASRARGPKGEDLGFVGEIAGASTRLIRSLLDAKFLPVVAPLARAQDAEHAYNVNADLAAAALAAALRADAFILVTNVRRVLRDPDDPASGIDRFSPSQAERFAATDACRSSMKPKLQAAAIAVRGGARAAYICAAKSGAIAAALRGDATVITAAEM